MIGPALDANERETLTALLRSTRRIAVVGLSGNPQRDSNEVARYLLRQGYEVVPVNPNETEVLGLTCYPDLQSVPGQIDMVDVFRASDAVPAIVDDAIAIGATSLWLQLGVIHQDAAQRAAAAGLSVVMDRCIKVDHARLLG